MGNKPDKLPEHCCARCHFFCVYVVKYNDKTKEEGPTPELLSSQDIRDFLENDFKLLNPKAQKMGNWNLSPGSPKKFLGCYHAVWKADGVDQNGQTLTPVPDEMTTNRRDFCFFYHKVDGMSFKAANTLEHRAANRREADKDRALAFEAAQSAYNSAEAANENVGVALESANTAKKAVKWAIIALAVNACLIIANMRNIQKVEIVSPYEQYTHETTVQEPVNRTLEMRALDDKQNSTDK